MKELVPVQKIEQVILLIRGHKVMLDRDLATLYGVSVGRLNEAVKRDRFPDDFMFQLTPQEFEVLISQIAISNIGRGGRRYLPFAFTEQGVAMLSGVLKSKRAVQVNIQIMRAFIRLRHILASHKELAHKLDELEKKYDTQFRAVFDAIRQLMAPVDPKRHRIGFRQ